VPANAEGCLFVYNSELYPMNRILPIFILCMSLQSVYAQIDIAVIDVNISSNLANQTPIDLTTGVEISIENMGPNSLAVGDTVLASISYNNSLIQHAFELEAALDSGSVTTLAFGPTNRIDILSTWDTIAFEAHIQVSGDSVDSNDFYHEEYYATTAINNDWSGAEITILAPSNLNNFDIYNGTNVPPPLSSIEINLVNNGDVTYLEHSILDYTIYLGNDESSLRASIGAGGVSGGETTTRLVSNQAVLPSIPDSAAVHQLCVRTEAAQDATANNDASCKVFTILDNYDPNDPNNWPWATPEIGEYNTSLFVANDNLIVRTEASRYDLLIFDLSGKAVHQSAQEGNAQVTLDVLSNGLYFARIITPETTELANHKFVIVR